MKFVLINSRQQRCYREKTETVFFNLCLIIIRVPEVFSWRIWIFPLCVLSKTNFCKSPTSSTLCIEFLLIRLDYFFVMRYGGHIGNKLFVLWFSANENETKWFRRNKSKHKHHKWVYFHWSSTKLMKCFQFNWSWLYSCITFIINFLWICGFPIMHFCCNLFTQYFISFIKNYVISIQYHSVFFHFFLVSLHYFKLFPCQIHPCSSYFGLGYQYFLYPKLWAHFRIFVLLMKIRK